MEIEPEPPPVKLTTKDKLAFAGVAAVMVGPVLVYYARAYWQHWKWAKEDREERGR